MSLIRLHNLGITMIAESNPAATVLCAFLYLTLWSWRDPSDLAV